MDAHLSSWGVRQFVPGMALSPIVYVSANWDGNGLEPGDMAVDISAGGHGIKGVKDADGTVHSSADYIISKYASREDALAIKDLVRFVDIQDAHGSVVNYLIKGSSSEARRVFAVTSIGAVSRALEYAHPNDSPTVFNRMSEIFDGFLLMGRANVRAIAEADKAEIFANGKVALIRGKKERRTSHILLERGALVIIYVDGLNIGVRTGRKTFLRDGSIFRADHPVIRQIVTEAGENDWFAHSKGFLYCHGSRKAPALLPSKVDPYKIVQATAILLY